MNVSVIWDKRLVFDVVSALAQTHPFTLVTPLLSGRYVQLLESLPSWVKWNSEIFLAKTAENVKLGKRLASGGYRVFVVRNLHAKGIFFYTGRRELENIERMVVGSMNFTDEIYNVELVFLIEYPTVNFLRTLDEVFFRRLRKLARSVEEVSVDDGRSGDIERGEDSSDKL